MRLLDDERGQSVQVGAAILLGFVVIAVTIYQVQVVSSQNAEVEFNHNQEVRQDLVELRNAINNAGTQGTSDAISVKLGGQYPPRTIFVNPAPIRGEFRTEPAGNISFDNVELANDPNSYEGTGDPNDLISENHTTKRVVYNPHYFELDDAGVTNLEHSLLFNTFQNNATDPLTQQNAVGSTDLQLTVLQGNLTEQGSQSVSLDPTTVSGLTTDIRVQNQSNGPIQLHLPTETPSVWNETIGTNAGSDEPYVDRYFEDNSTIRVHLPPGGYDLRMALVRLGNGGESSNRYDVQSPESGNGSSDSAYRAEWEDPQPNGSLQDCATAGCSNDYQVIANTDAVDLVAVTNPERISGADVDFSYRDPNGTINNSIERDVFTDGTANFTLKNFSSEGVVYAYVASGGTSEELSIDVVSKPVFDVTITDTNSPINPGDELLVDVTIDNTGSEAGAQDIILDFNANLSQEDVQEVTVASGDIQDITLSYNTTEADGNYPVEVRSDDTEDQTTVTLGSAPYFEVRDFQAPSSAEPGDTITVNATIENTGTEQDSQTIEYRFDGESVDSPTETIAPDETTQVEFTHTLQSDQEGGDFTHGIFSENSSDSNTIIIDVAPSIDQFNIDDQSQCTGPGNSCNQQDEAIFEIAWAVSDDNGDLDTVTINLYPSGETTPVDTEQIDVSGGSASGTNTVSDTGGYDDDYTIEIVVDDNAGHSTTDSQTDTADGE